MLEPLERHRMPTLVIGKQTADGSQPDTWSFPTLAQRSKLGGSKKLEEELWYHPSLWTR